MKIVAILDDQGNVVNTIVVDDSNANAEFLSALQITDNHVICDTNQLKELINEAVESTYPPYPTDGNFYVWNEQSSAWVSG